ncbi:MAG: hypothetical protein KAJ44_03590, partial [Thermoplasmatales archaeon]|nr:hypothetical protein [Thermoplasmatales archaeon]
VGYQTTKSSTIARASPLFTVRSKRAIDEESKGLTCDYVGKGQGSKIFLPSPDDKITLIRKFIDKIAIMDDKTFRWFLTSILSRINYNDRIKDENFIEVMLSLQYIRYNPEDLIDYLNNINNKPEDKCVLEQQDYTAYGEWKPRCFIELIVDAILTIIVYIFYPFILLISVMRDCLQSIDTMCEDCPCFRPQSKY